MAQEKPAVERVYKPQLIAWEVTRRCGLKCRHCRAAAENVAYQGELSTSDCMRLMDNVASFAKPIMILTGGEPLMRPDIYDIASYGDKLGLRMVLATCGLGLSEAVARKLKDNGIQRLSLSIDGSAAETHDKFRNVPGAFEGVMKAAEAANRAGLPFQINTTVSKINVDDLPAILDLAIKIGASAFHPFLLVPVGRGEDIRKETLDPEKYEAILTWVAEQQGKLSIPFKPTCAPHYHRIVRQKKIKPMAHPVHGDKAAAGHPGGMDFLSRGCLGGLGFAFISHVGQVQICGFLEEKAGNIKSENMDFRKIWETSPLFLTLREKRNYRGKCGRCPFWQVCGGCRARGETMQGHYLEPEPNCLYEPPEHAGAAS